MKPTDKAPEIDEFLTATTGLDRRSAIEAGKCVWCKRDATEFRNAVSVAEYKISGLCQRCQDEVFGDD